MLEAGKIFLGSSRGPDGRVRQGEYLDLKLANRHGLVTGATGTGKTVTLQILAEAFSEAGVPVFCADVKGDLSGIALPGDEKDTVLARAQEVGLDPYHFDAHPVAFWDLFGEKGHKVRTTIAEMGPLLLSRLMNLSDAQEGVLNIAFKIADEDGLLLLDLKDLHAMLAHVAENAEEISRLYGNVAKQSVGAIQRSLLVLEQQGANEFFGEPALRIADLMRIDRDGRGVISVLSAERLMMNPKLYATFLLWLLSELFEELPEVGDPEKPKLVFFFDEAHLLFDDAPKILVDRIEQVVKLIRSKGVGVYFVTQNPLDLPDGVLAQLGNRIQHALRAYTPREQKAVRTAAETFRANPEFDCFEAITQLGVGEALVSTLGDGGVPSVVQRTSIRPPAGRLGPATDAERADIMRGSPLAGQYDHAVDPESAYELLARRADEALERQPDEQGIVQDRVEDQNRETSWFPDFGLGRDAVEAAGDDTAIEAPRHRAPVRRRSSGYQRQTLTETVMKQVGRTVASTVTNAVLRGILGGFTRRR